MKMLSRGEDSLRGLSLHHARHRTERLDASSPGGTRTKWFIISEVDVAESMSSRSADIKENQNLDNVLSKHAVTAEANGGGGGGGRKRPLEEGNNRRSQPHGYKPRKRKKAGGLVAPKNALMQLNEVQPGLQYALRSQSGPVHAPVFVMSVEVNGQRFEGSGSTKKKAKLNAAEKALRSFVQFPNASEAHAAMGRTPCVLTDFTSDRADFSHVLFNAFETSAPVDDPFYLPADSGFSFEPDPPRFSFPPRPAALAAAARPKNPIMILNELRPGLKYHFLSESGQSHAKNFVVSLTVEARTFQGSGRNKRLAKARAAQAALAAMFHLQLDQEPSRRPVARDGLQLHLPPQVLADTVSRLVIEKFGELTDNFTSPHARRKVLAGVVMTTGSGVKEPQVVCVSTGTKCISSEHVSDRGLSLNDCHAEIVARRSVIRFLYSQLELFLSGDADEQQTSIFTESEDGRGFRLKDDVQFHLYVSTSPCGDARIFSPHEVGVEDQGDKHPNRKPRGQLRTKMESGEGTVPVGSSDATQTWDGVVQGQRLLAMSCSDKMARWNVLGFQGSLMTFFTPPVYFSSVVVGSLYHAQHLSRALYQRIGDVDPPGSYVLNRPLLSGISNAEARQPGKAPNFSVNWAVGDQGLEVIDAATGKDERGRPSRLCKGQLYRRWRRLHCGLSSILRIQTVTPSSYHEAKQAAVEYHRAKQAVFMAFLRAGLGTWRKKPLEQEQFAPSP